MIASRMSSLVGSTAPTCIPLKIALWFDDTVLSFQFNSRRQSTSVDYELQVQKADCYCTYVTMVKKITFSEIICFIHEALYPFGGRVVKGVGHLDHVWSYGVREVVSSITDRGNIVGWVFHPTRWLVRFSLIWICLSFQILNLFRTLSSWGSGNYRPSAPFLYEVASHVKKTAIPANIIIRHRHVLPLQTCQRPMWLPRTVCTSEDDFPQFIFDLITVE